MKNNRELSEFNETIKAQIKELLCANNNSGIIASKIEELDDVTTIHINSVRDITEKICRKLEMSEKKVDYCSNAAFLHDIGKILISPKIINKEGKLDDLEYKTIKLHTIIGAEICDTNEELARYRNAVLYHHENEDGTGYPEGLKGDKIPYVAKLIKVADVYDAIRSKRSYKDEMNRIESLKIMYEAVKKGKINGSIFAALLDVVIDEIRMENGSNDEIKQILYMKKNIIGTKKNHDSVIVIKEQEFLRA